MRILKFGNERCAPCKILNEEIKNLNLEGIEIISITKVTHPGWFEKYNVKSIPLLIEIDSKQNFHLLENL